MIKGIYIQVDNRSWTPPSSVPSELKNVASKIRQTNALAALLHTALWTRPPCSFGFSFADCWAWLRYGPALSNATDIRLRSEWNDIDAHQKTVLSDEMGVGFTTQLFAEILNFSVYADTQYVVRILPSLFSLRRKAKRGPAKSPDYIIVDNILEVSVLECKGSQKSRQTLIKAVIDGVTQKNNFIVSSGSSIKHSSAGLFIPQSGNSESSLIYVRDPEPDQITVELLTVPRNNLLIGIIQIGLAKHFALMGLYSMADALSSTVIVEKPTKLENINLRERDRLITQESERNLSFVQEVPLPPGLFHKGDTSATSIRFQMQCSVELYDRLVNTNNVAEEIDKIINNLKEIASLDIF